MNRRATALLKKESLSVVVNGFLLVDDEFPIVKDDLAATIRRLLDKSL